MGLLQCGISTQTTPLWVKSSDPIGPEPEAMSAPLPKAAVNSADQALQRTMSSSLNPRRMTMEDDRSTLPTPKRTPWNKGKLIGAKPPLLARHVWSIRTKLQIERRTRDLAMFNLAIDSKLRGCDVIAIRVEDIAPNGYALARATVRQKKTGRPVRFELTEQTRQAVDDYLKVTGKVAGGFLFTSRRRPTARPDHSGS